jgi:putative colanic acid biosynthesis UDP-glucose lipid carrier transferase
VTYQTETVRSHRVWWDACLPALDACSIVSSLAVVRIAYKGTMEDATFHLALVATIIFLIIAQITGLHRHPRPSTIDRELASIASTWALTVVVLAMISLATRSGEVYARSELFSWFIAAPITIGLGRMSARVVQFGAIYQRVGTRRVAIAGYNGLGQKVASELRTHSTLGWLMDGFYDDREVIREQIAGNVQDSSSKISGDLNALIRKARAGEIDTVLVTLPMRAETRIRDVLRQLSDSTVSVYVVPDIFVFDLLHSRWTHIGHLSAVSIFENPLDGIDGFAKRSTDVLLATLALLVAAIPMLLIALAIKLTSPGPVFFRQKRYGLDGRAIRVWKFRSMRTCDDGAVVKQATKGDARITPLGAILRKTSLDELPQLFNVLVGSMSLVGPRPHAAAHNEEYRRQIQGYMLRHKVKPGITGLAQVNGCRGETDTLEKMERRVELDHQYIRGWSLWLDIKILLRTLVVAWRQPEAY